MALTDDALRDLHERARYDDPLALMLEHGYPLTKGSYLVAATMGVQPDFPLDAELRAMIPSDLPGKTPRTEEDWLVASEAVTQATPAISTPKSRRPAEVSEEVTNATPAISTPKSRRPAKVSRRPDGSWLVT